MRFNEMKRYLGKVTDKTLSLNLKELEADVLVARISYNEVRTTSPRCSSTLSCRESDACVISSGIIRKSSLNRTGPSCSSAMMNIDHLPVRTFCEAHDFSGKTVVAFGTCGSTGMGESADAVRKLLAESATVIDGGAFVGRPATDEEIAALATLGD